MYQAVLKEGPRAPLFYLGAAILLAATGTTAAQTVEQSELERCAGLQTTELKLACFEALAKVQDKDIEETVESTASTVAEPLPEDDVTETELVTPAVTAGAAASSIEPAPSVAEPGAQDEQIGIEEPVPDKAVAADSVGDSKGAEIPVADEARADQLGSEHLVEKNVEKEKADADVRLMVREVVKGNYDVLYFHLANGQIWRQIEPRRFSYPRKGEFEVVISRGMMRDYRLRVAGNSPMTPIRRIQ